MSVKIKNLDSGNNIVTIKDGDEIHEVQAVDVEKNLYSFEWGEEYYFFELYSKWGESYSKPFIREQILEGGWNDLKDKLSELADEYKDYNVEDETTPSAPDTSKFISVKKGDMQLREDYTYRRETWSSDYYPYLVTIGTALFHRLPDDFWHKLLNIFADAIESGFRIGVNGARLGYIVGTAWIGFGLK